ncbi:hypothetical protein [Paenibacillus nuruki]|uniref:hypothetical protein n=1 Tax=Paenibacillus nuruki TaxID=1886670 RepID=UPI002803E743|nr:hypothetical protein [Paenibacillus nuruki]CAJ1315938.1 hypothetical protein AASFL403_12000 [Paenibacillus nuruki]
MHPKVKLFSNANQHEVEKEINQFLSSGFESIPSANPGQRMRATMGSHKLIDIKIQSVRDTFVALVIYE